LNTLKLLAMITLVLGLIAIDDSNKISYAEKYSSFNTWIC
jgi:hypothetical protein